MMMASIMFDVLIIDNFISKKDCEYLLNMSSKLDCWVSKNDPFWDKRCFNVNLLENNNEIKIKMSLILKKVKTTILKSYSLEKIYPDLFEIVKWPVGLYQEPHHDDMTSYLKDEENIHKHRMFGSIIYLNDNFDGGETYYPQHNKTIKPKSGTLVVHPGTSDYMHGVAEVKNNTRYTIASFWGVDEKRNAEF